MDDSKGRALGAGKFARVLSRYTARTGLIGAATIVGGLMIGSAPASAFTSSPLWTCRGSALSASVSGQNRVEPVVANGNPDTGNGASPNYAQCVNSDVGENNLATPVGLPANFLSAPTADASTTISPEIGPSIQQTFVSKGGVENLALNLGGPTTILGVGAANASVTGTCKGSTPTLTGQSQAVNLTLGGSVLSLDPLLTAVSQLLAPLHEIISIKVNEQIRTATGLTVNALHITILNSTTNAPVVDLIVGQAVGGFDPNVCNPNAQYVIPPGIVGSGGTNSSNSGVGLTNQAYNGNIGSSNGPQATCGHLTMYFVANHTKSLTDTYGQRQVTRGRIVSCGSKPKSIVGARIDVIHIVNGTRHLIKTGLRSRPGGLLTLILPLNLTSRSIEYDYRGKLNSTHVTSKQVLSLTVKTRAGKKI
ncbi:MAG TPA: choice-of-anchor P family protein [Solirubrobacteraceae bacterium]|jgi:hypothetical protein|nr:choice-of-anchor P family protein [Solirubrobacteraceae bacterium]